MSSFVVSVGEKLVGAIFIMACLGVLIYGLGVGSVAGTFAAVISIAVGLCGVILAFTLICVLFEILRMLKEIKNKLG